LHSRSYCQDYDAANPATHAGRDLTRMPMAELYKAFGLDDMTIEFVGHSLALHSTDEYLRLPARVGAFCMPACPSVRGMTSVHWSLTWPQLQRRPRA